MKEFLKEVLYISIIAIFSMVIGMLIINIKHSDNKLELYECEVTAWYAGQGYENHNIEDVLSWELDKNENEVTFQTTFGWIWINADDIDYICYTQVD